MDLGVSYVSAHVPDHIDADMRHLAEIGCTEVLFALQENHIYHLTGALRFGAAIAKESGLRPYAVIWGYANTFGGGRISKIMLDDPELWCRTKEGDPYPQACLNNPKLVERFIEIAALCREHGFEGVFVDEPTKQECFCSHCREAYSATAGRDLPGDESSPEYAAFRAQAARDYTAAVCRAVKELDSDLRTIACIMPHDREMWSHVAAIPELDVFGTDPYWLVSRGKMTLQQAVDDAVDVKRICLERGKISQIWLNCWRIPAGLEEEIERGGRELAEVGCDSLYTWSYRGGLGTNEECDDPSRAWSSVVRLYRELSGRA